LYDVFDRHEVKMFCAWPSPRFRPSEPHCNSKNKIQMHTKAIAMGALGGSAPDEPEAEIDLPDAVRYSREWQPSSPAAQASAQFIIWLVVLGPPR
jgi:hypothetical protein